jgi:DNA replication and repair protein RecF
MLNQPVNQAEPKPEVHTVGSLTLTNFRNHFFASLTPSEKSVVLYGHNGAGKTNILEALSLLAPGRGFRRSKPTEMDTANGSGSWVVSAEVYGKIGAVQIGTGRESNILPSVNGGDNSERRMVRVNGEPLKSHNQLSEYVSVVWLTPQMDMLFLEGGTARRKFLDRLVYGFDATHAGRVNRYELAMRERNKLLAMPRVDGDWLAGIEAQMAAEGVAIAFARAEAVEHINAVMQMSTLDFPKAELALAGVIEDAVAARAAAIDVEHMFKKMLYESRAVDAQAGRTLGGVHRAEFRVTHVQKNMEAALCSTGEQKALLLAIVLAEARASSLWHGHVPILLFDEVAAHLDPQKRAELYKEIQALNAQVWMSGVSRDLFEEMHDNTMFFRVEHGQVFTE